MKNNFIPPIKKDGILENQQNNNEEFDFYKFISKYPSLQKVVLSVLITTQLVTGVPFARNDNSFDPLISIAYAETNFTINRLQQILDSLNEGAKNSKKNFSSEAVFLKAYTYSSKSYEEQLVLKDYWKMYSEGKKSGITFNTSDMNKWYQDILNRVKELRGTSWTCDPINSTYYNENGWINQPRLIIEGQTYTFDTPQGYIDKIKSSIKSNSNYNTILSTRLNDFQKAQEYWNSVVIPKKNQPQQQGGSNTPTNQPQEGVNNNSIINQSSNNLQNNDQTNQFLDQPLNSNPYTVPDHPNRSYFSITNYTINNHGHWVSAPTIIISGGDTYHPDSPQKAIDILQRHLDLGYINPEINKTIEDIKKLLKGNGNVNNGNDSLIDVMTDEEHFQNAFSINMSYDDISKVAPVLKIGNNTQFNISEYYVDDSGHWKESKLPIITYKINNKTYTYSHRHVVDNVMFLKALYNNTNDNNIKSKIKNAIIDLDKSLQLSKQELIDDINKGKELGNGQRKLGEYLGALNKNNLTILSSEPLTQDGELAKIDNETKKYNLSSGAAPITYEQLFDLRITANNKPVPNISTPEAKEMNKITATKYEFAKNESRILKGINGGSDKSEKYKKYPYTIIVEYNNNKNNPTRNYPADIRIEYFVPGGNTRFTETYPIKAQNFQQKELIKQLLEYKVKRNIDNYFGNIALIIIKSKFTNYGWYFESGEVLKDSLISGDVFKKYVLDENMLNIKVNKDLNSISTYINVNEGKGKMFIIDGKKYWLSDFGNIGYGFVGYKAGYSLNELKTLAMIISSMAGDDGYKPEGFIENEFNDWPFYEAGYFLGKNKKSVELTEEDLLQTYLKVLPNGRK